MLEAELLLTLGACAGGGKAVEGAAQLHAAESLARRIGAVSIAGRALLLQHDHEGGSRQALEQACLDLVECPAWRTRAYLALAQALCSQPGARTEALEICASTLCRFSTMELPYDEERARTLLWRLSAVRC